MQNNSGQDSRFTTSTTAIRRCCAGCTLQIPREEQCACSRVERNCVAKAEVGTWDPAVTDHLGHPVLEHDREEGAIERYLRAESRPALAAVQMAPFGDVLHARRGMRMYDAHGAGVTRGNGHIKKSTARRQEPELAATPNVLLYLRVSTGRQAEQDLSIPDQRTYFLPWCQSHGWRIVAEYVERGASAENDRRQEFQKMVEQASNGENAFDIVVVHSLSRFFRNAIRLEFDVRRLAKHGVRLPWITQELRDDLAQVMTRAGDRAVPRVPVKRGRNFRTASGPSKRSGTTSRRSSKSTTSRSRSCARCSGSFLKAKVGAGQLAGLSHAPPPAQHPKAL